MRIAILGATSHIARDLIVSLTSAGEKNLYLYARRPDIVAKWLDTSGLSKHHFVDDFSGFGRHKLDAIINFVGVGNPAQAAALGNAIFETTLRFDEMALEYVRANSNCRYLFLSSGAAYGSKFDAPANHDTPAVVSINDMPSQEWYGVAKLHAESRHRSHSGLSIIDIRIFNYFSHTQDINARFLISDILRAIRDQVVLETSPDNIVRDFLHPEDFFRLVRALLSSPASNTAVDCYSRAPIEKFKLLYEMQAHYGLKFEAKSESAFVNTTGTKPYYYSVNKRAADFGYQPALTSLDGIMRETRTILQRLRCV